VSDFELILLNHHLLIDTITSHHRINEPDARLNATGSENLPKKRRVGDLGGDIDVGFYAEPAISSQ
jgi:hypothetical protein